MAKRALDSLDLAILERLQDDARVRLENIAKAAGVPKSTIHYRVKKLERAGFIKGYFAKIDPTLFGMDLAAVSLIRGRYGPRYHERLGKKLAAIRGVWLVYFVFGDWDFVVISRSRSRQELTKIIEKIINMKEVERGSTLITFKNFKEEHRIELK